MRPASPIPVIAPARPAPARAELEAPTAEFLRLDGASGEASPETIRSYQAEVGAGVRWCEARGIVPAEASGRRQLKRLRDRLMLSLMALHGLRTTSCTAPAWRTSASAARTWRSWCTAKCATASCTCGPTPPSGSRPTWRCAARSPPIGHADPRTTARYAHVVDMAKRNPALFIPVSGL